MTLNEYSLEAHLNVVTQGTPLRDGTLLPTEHQTHLTLEPTFGLSENFALGFMFLNAWEPGYSPQFALTGTVSPGTMCAPESWRLPFKLGFVSEFSFQKTRYERRIRGGPGLRPILDREFSRWEVVFNPVFERALRGPGTAHGWNFEPAMLVRWKREKFSPSLEYYGEVDSINRRPRRATGSSPDLPRWRLENGAGVQHQHGGGV